MIYHRHWKKGAVAYIRVCCKQSIREAVLDTQRAECERLAAILRINLVGEYIDLDCPPEFDRQLELQRCLRDLSERSDADFLLVTNLEILGTTLTDLDQIIPRIDTSNTEILTCNGVEAHGWYEQVRENEKKGLGLPQRVSR